MNQQLHSSAAGPRALFAALCRDFAPWPGLSLRLVDEIACLAAVLLAIAGAHLLGIGNVGWAAFSAYMVIRSAFADSLWRGMLRVLGTAVGVALACLLAPLLMHATILLSGALAVCGAVTLYLALLGQRGYGWLMAGLSFAMVLIDGMQHPAQALGQFAQARLLEVVLGSGAAVLVSALATWALRRHLPPATPGTPNTLDVLAPDLPSCRRAALRHALQGALALALIPWLWCGFHLQALSQSSITIMAVMMVPRSDLGRASAPAATRLRHRLFGSGIGGLLATAVLLLSHASPVLMTLAACVGVVVGRHIENGKLHITYAGTQFALAFLVVLVPDSYAAAGTGAMPAIERLAGIFLGMAMLETVRRLGRAIPVRPPRSRPRGSASTSSTAACARATLSRISRALR